MKNTIAVAVLALTVLPAEAVLPPFYNSADQIRAILENNDVAEQSKGLVIHSLVRDEHSAGRTNRWILKVGDRSLCIEVTPQVRAEASKQPPMPGPVNWQVSTVETCESN